MEIQLIKKNRQARGQFNGGEILENKPIGFPREGGHLKPYSNLFYWAHAWSEKGSTIGLHPHQGFEIMSFVIKGSIAHFDTGGNEWKTLETGAAQIIRSGNGISHSEKINPGAHMFQIWLDPNLEKTLSKPASYDDYPSTAFPNEEEDGVVTKIYMGKNSPMKMDTEGVEIRQKELDVNHYKLSLDEDKIHSIYLVEGKLNVGADEVEADDFMLVKEAKEIELKVEEKATLFIVSTPAELTYKSYAERMIG